MLVLYKSDKRAVLKIDKNDKSTFCNAYILYQSRSRNFACLQIASFTTLSIGIVADSTYETHCELLNCQAH